MINPASRVTIPRKGFDVGRQPIQNRLSGMLSMLIQRDDFVVDGVNEGYGVGNCIPFHGCILVLLSSSKYS